MAVAYSAEAGEIVKQTLAEGHSLGGAAGVLGIARQTLFNWRDRHPEFNQACEEGLSLARLFWERKLIEAAVSGKGMPGALIFALKNRAPADWREDVTFAARDGDGRTMPINLSIGGWTPGTDTPAAETR